jgi:menaquinone-specific isochorismate synthase
MLQEEIDPFLESGALIGFSEKQLALGFGEAHWLASPPSGAAFAFYFPDFFLQEQKPWLVFEKMRLISHEDLLKALSPSPIVARRVWQPISKSDFLQQFESAQEAFKKKWLHKVVLFAFERGEGPITAAERHASLVSALEHAKRYPLHIYGFWNSREGLLGATPELLFRQRVPGRVETVAIAGTTTGNSWDAKLKKEHEIVVKGIVESLSSCGQLSLGQMTLLPYAKFSHLMTPIEMESEKPLAFEDLVTRLHPTPALGAYPREAGKIWLAEIQKRLNRRRFGAPVGLKAGDEGHCFVAIRNVQWQQDQVMLGAGCGVVLESELEKEWLELQQKLKAIKEVINL